MLSNDLCFLSSPGRPQLAQQTSVIYSCPGFANGSEPCQVSEQLMILRKLCHGSLVKAKRRAVLTPASALSTYASPSTSRRILIPCLKASEDSELLDILGVVMVGTRVSKIRIVALLKLLQTPQIKTPNGRE